MASDFSKAAKKVKKLRKELPRQHERETKDAMETIHREVRATVRKNGSVARRTLISDVREGEYTDPTMVSRSVNVPEWGKYLEHGTGSRGTQDTLPSHDTFKSPSPIPPIEPIETWVLAKNITSNEYDAPLELAKAIQNEIGRLGTFPHPFLRPVWYGTYGYQNVITANRRAQRIALRRSF